MFRTRKARGACLAYRTTLSESNAPTLTQAPLFNYAPYRLVCLTLPEAP
jgi:hypothetical protein